MWGFFRRSITWYNLRPILEFGLQVLVCLQTQVNSKTLDPRKSNRNCVWLFLRNNNDILSRYFSEFSRKNFVMLVPEPCSFPKIIVKCPVSECNKCNILSRTAPDKPATNPSNFQDKHWRKYTVISKRTFMSNWMTRAKYVQGVLQHTLLTSRKITNYKMQIYK